ncbi:hypothetical protein, partial [Methylobacterium sp. J-067]|uniref:hypothetical protein n=1 Tax=Methylobacterium sp. J-067 TaxID=2836648 RepID=UPI001FB98B47
RSGRKKTSDQVVSDPTAVCLPNMTAGEKRSRAPNSHIPSSRCKISSQTIRAVRPREPLQTCFPGGSTKIQMIF